MLNGFGETQRKLLNELLQNKAGMTIAQLGKSLNISRTAVNQHISALEKESYLQKFTQNSTGGRPGQIYQLSGKGIQLFPKQYALFSKLLLKNLKQKMGGKDLEALLTDLGEQIAGQFLERVQKQEPTKKIDEIALIMRELGYESVADSSDEIKACNCVYHDIALDNPEICSFDLALLSTTSGREVKHVECMVRGGQKCRFEFKKKLKSTQKSHFQVLEKSH